MIRFCFLFRTLLDYIHYIIHSSMYITKCTQSQTNTHIFIFFFFFLIIFIHMVHTYESPLGNKRDNITIQFTTTVIFHTLSLLYYINIKYRKKLTFPDSLDIRFDSFSMVYVEIVSFFLGICLLWKLVLLCFSRVKWLDVSDIFCFYVFLMKLFTDLSTETYFSMCLTEQIDSKHIWSNHMLLMVYGV